MVWKLRVFILIVAEVSDEEAREEFMNLGLYDHLKETEKFNNLHNV